MRHHYTRLMTNLQQPGEQYWLIAVLSHGKSPCARSPHLHRQQRTCWSGLRRFYEMTQPWESLGLDLAFRVFPESEPSRCCLFALAVSSIRLSLNISSQLFTVDLWINSKCFTKQHFLPSVLRGVVAWLSFCTKLSSSWCFSTIYQTRWMIRECVALCTNLDIYFFLFNVFLWLETHHFTVLLLTDIVHRDLKLENILVKNASVDNNDKINIKVRWWDKPWNVPPTLLIHSVRMGSFSFLPISSLGVH